MYRELIIILIILVSLNKGFCQKPIILYDFVGKERKVYVLGDERSVYIGKKDIEKFKIEKFEDSILVYKSEEVFGELIAGDLVFVHLSGHGLNEGAGRIFLSKIECNDSLFFQGIIFPSGFKNSVISNQNRRPLYKGSLVFYSSGFKDEIKLKNSIFEKSVIFNSSYFKKKSDFENCSFNKDFIVEDCLFSFPIDSIFKKNKDSLLKKSLMFLSEESDSSLMGAASLILDESIFNKQVSFDRSILGNLLSLKSTKFAFAPTFNGSTLPRIIDFRGAMFNYSDNHDSESKIDFRKSVITPSVELSANSSFGFSIGLISEVYKRAKNNKCKIYLKNTEANKFIIPFELFILGFSADDTYEEKASIYESIINTCKQAGMAESAQAWDIEYRKLQLNHDWPTFGKLIIAFNEYWWDFGYEKWRILIFWLPFFFLCFFTWNYFRIIILWDYMYKDNELGKMFRKARANLELPKQHGWKRLSFTFFYTAVIYFGFKIRHEAVNYDYTRGLLYLYLMYAVGTIHMAFAFSYIISAY